MSSRRDNSLFKCQYSCDFPNGDKSAAQRSNSDNGDGGNKRRGRKVLWILPIGRHSVNDEAHWDKSTTIIDDRGRYAVDVRVNDAISLRRDASYFNWQFATRNDRTTSTLSTENLNKLEELEQDIADNEDVEWKNDNRKHAWSRHRIYKMWNDQYKSHT